MTRNDLRLIVGRNAVIVEAVEPLTVWVVDNDFDGDPNVLAVIAENRPIGIDIELMGEDRFEELIRESLQRRYDDGYEAGKRDRWWRRLWTRLVG